MIKRIGVMGTAALVVMALAALGSASAASASQCLKVSAFVAGTKGGNFTNGSCVTETTILDGEWVLASPLFPTTGNLWCAKLLLTSGEKNSGYYKEKNCTVVLTGSEVNKSDYTEVIYTLPAIT